MRNNKDLSFGEAIHEGMTQAMQLDKKVVCYGLGVGKTANVFGNLYGTDKKFVYDQLQISDVILELDWQGAESIKRIFPDAFLISLIPPSYKDLEYRLIVRALDTDNAISKRLSESRTEVTKCLSFDFLILNDEFKKALNDLKEIIFNKKKVNEFESRVSSKLTKNLLDLN